MRHVALFGSPKKRGHSAALHEAFISGMGPGAAPERLFLYDLNIGPCEGCGRCHEALLCPLDDDMPRLYPLLRDAALVTISSPLYFSGPSAPLKCFIDRCQALWEAARRGEIAAAGKTGYLLVTGGAQYEGMFAPTVTIIRHFYNSIGCSYREDEYLLVPGIDAQGCVPGDELERAVRMGRVYAERLQHGGRQ